MWYIKKILKLSKLEFFLCALMTHLQNIERNFTFTRKRTDNEERNEIGVSLSDSDKELGNMPYSTETWLIIDTIPKNICTSFAKYVEKYNQSVEQA